MSSNINLKNDINTEFTLEHNDGVSSVSKTYCNTIAELNSIQGTDGDMCTCSDATRGGDFIYKGSEIVNDNQGTIFNGWVRQYKGSADVRWFGAIGDGVADDTVYLQKFLDIGGELNLSVGTYISTVLTAKGSTTLSGSGTIKLKGGSNSSLLTTIADATDILIKDVTLDGDYINNVSGVDSQATLNIASGCYNVTLDNVKVLNNDQNGIQLNQGCSNVSILNCKVRYSANRRGIELSRGTGTSDIIVRDCVVGDNLYGNITATSTIKGLSVTGNYCYGTMGGTGGDNITGYNSASSNILISGNTLVDSGNHGIHIAGTDIIVANNIIKDATQNGIYITDGVNCLLSNNVINTVNQSGILVSLGSDNVYISNNIITNVTANHGILFGTNILNASVSIHGNRLKTVNSTAIRIEGDSADNCSITDNNIDGCLYGIQFSLGVSVKTHLVARNIIKNATTSDIQEASGSQYSNRYIDNIADTIDVVTSSTSSIDSNMLSLSFADLQIDSTSGTDIVWKARYNYSILNSSTTTTIVDFEPKWNGRRIDVILNNANVTIVDGTLIGTKAGADISGTGTRVSLIYGVTKWQEF